MADNASFEMAQSHPLREKIGPGVVMLVVGPSGAGKDALLQGAAAELQADPRFVFPMRIVSRPEHSAEYHERASHDEMIAAEQVGGYALSWQAHGLMYGISVDIDEAVRSGKTVVFNTSRAVVGIARERFRNVVSLYVDAPVELRAKRLSDRGRETEMEIAERLARVVDAFRATDADVVIQNDASLRDGVHRLVSAIDGMHSQGLSN